MDRTIYNKTSLVIFAGLVFFASALLVQTQTASAQSVWTALDGGRSTAIYCTCTPGCFNVFVGPPRGGSFMYCPGTTRLYAYYNIWNAWQLGGNLGWMPCMQIGFPSCFPSGGGNIMIINGTSAY
jgi:hypothetical protein